MMHQPPQSPLSGGSTQNTSPDKGRRGGVFLTVENISKSFGGVQALHDCSIEIPANEITALVGPNGAGKTTLFDVMSGLVKPDEGTVALGEYDLTSMSPHRIAQVGIARSWQQVRLFRYLTIADHLYLAAGNEEVDIAAVLQKFGLDPTSPGGLRGAGLPAETVVTDLSYGQRKLLQLAMVATMPHQLMLLDEPVAGVNAVLQEKIEQMLLNWKETNETIVVIEHDIEFVKRLADYVVVLHHGSVLADGRPEEVLQDERVVNAYLGA